MIYVYKWEAAWVDLGVAETQKLYFTSKGKMAEHAKLHFTFNGHCEEYYTNTSKIEVR